MVKSLVKGSKGPRIQYSKILGRRVVVVFVQVLE